MPVDPERLHGEPGGSSNDQDRGCPCGEKYAEARCPYGPTLPVTRSRAYSSRPARCRGDQQTAVGDELEGFKVAPALPGFASTHQVVDVRLAARVLAVPG